jgi:hypothetical protein
MYLSSLRIYKHYCFDFLLAACCCNYSIVIIFCGSSFIWRRKYAVQSLFVGHCDWSAFVSPSSLCQRKTDAPRQVLVCVPVSKSVFMSWWLLFYQLTRTYNTLIRVPTWTDHSLTHSLHTLFTARRHWLTSWCNTVAMFVPPSPILVQR